MSRKIEFGAGVAAGVLALLGIIVLLLVPINYCTVPLSKTGTCPAGKVQTASVFHYLQLYADASIWIYLIVMLLLMLVGAGGAVTEARYGIRRGAIGLWAGGILAFMGCALFGTNLGLFFLPALLALAIASYASIFQRRLARLSPSSPAVESNAQPGQSGSRS
jgi:hypothetical protein